MQRAKIVCLYSGNVLKCWTYNCTAIRRISVKERKSETAIEIEREREIRQTIANLSHEKSTNKQMCSRTGTRGKLQFSKVDRECEFDLAVAKQKNGIPFNEKTSFIKFMYPETSILFSMRVYVWKCSYYNFALLKYSHAPASINIGELNKDFHRICARL